MSKRKRPKRSVSQMLFWLLSLIMVASMVISLVIVALEPPPPPTPTLPPTLTPTPRPTLTPMLGVQDTPTEPAIGPEVPTETPNAEATPAGAGGVRPNEAALPKPYAIA